MTDTYISASGAEVRDFNTIANIPAGVVGSNPTDPPDSTYIWPVTHLSAAGGGPGDTGTAYQFGIVYFDPVDVTTNGSPRIHLRITATVADGGFQSYPALSFYPLDNPFDYTASRIGPDVFPYPATWYTTGGPAGSYAMGTTQEAEFLIPVAAQTALRDVGLAVWVSINGSSSGAGDIGIQVNELRIALTAPANPPPLRRYPPVNNGGSGPTRHWPRTVNRRAGGTY